MIELVYQIKNNISDHSLDCKYLADKMNSSEQTLRRRLQKTLGLTPGTFIKNQRLAHAKELDEKGVFSSKKELAASVGFKTTSYFMKQYHQFLEEIDKPNVSNL